MSLSSFKHKLAMGGVLGLGAIASTVCIIHPFRKVSATAATIPPAVEVVRAEQKDVPVYGEWIGYLAGGSDALMKVE